jgi:Acyl-protein synthetase, LuxE
MPCDRDAPGTRMAIYDEILTFIETPRPERFDALMLKVFRYQFDSAIPYRQFCLSQGTRPHDVSSLDHIPALSTAAFKYAEVASNTIQAGESRVFFTSGTTVGRDTRGRHHVPRLDIYRASALRHAERMMFPDGAKMRMLSLHPTAERMPESSLGQMITWIIESFGAGEALCAASRSEVDVASALEFLRAAHRNAEPVCLMGTTAAFAELFDELRASSERLKLGQGSRLMDTGGAKGQAIPLGAGEVVEQARTLLGIDPTMVINEYGMTEMCSQLYDATPFNSCFDDPPGARRKLAPPWLAVTAVDPATLTRVPDGTPGLLQFFDLANVGSVSAILTGDVGVVDAGAVRLLGRTEDDEARGCALGIEQFASR